MGDFNKSTKTPNNAGDKQEVTMYKLYRVEMEDLSEYRKHNYKYVYAEDEADALIQVLDGLDVRVSVRGCPEKAQKRDVLDAAVELRENAAPLTKLRNFL